MGFLSRRRFVAASGLAGCGLLAGRTAWGQAEGAAAEAVTVETPLGALRGTHEEGVRVFRGVPFAEPPVGDLRFRAPVAKRAWTGVRDASRFASAAVQEGDRSVPQSEDCLYLNVWTPEVQAGGGKLPVFVWIHGGGFTGGVPFAKIFDGTGFAKQGMVLVTVAYRLGVLGFLDVEPLLGAGYPGTANNAVRDLMMALQWVQGNIAAFGGDPQRVTIGGESAGAKLTDLLTGVPAAKALFQGMISESGGAERIWPQTTAQAVAQGFGALWTKTTGQGIGTLKSAPARQLIDVQTEFLKTWPQHFPLRCELEPTVFPKPPVETIAAGSARGKRLLIGTNRDESALFLGAHPKKGPTASDLGNMGLQAFDQVYQRYATVYPEMSEEQRLIRAVTAEEYWVPSTRVAQAASRAGARVWAYELEFARSGGPFEGFAFHSEDIDLVWNKPEDRYSSAAAEATLARQMNAAWAAFVRGEAPAATGLPAWPEFEGKERRTMMLDRISKVEARPQEAELQLWSGFEPLG